MMTRRDMILATAATGLSARALAQTPPPGKPGELLRLPDPVETVDLWPGGAPGMPARPPVEQVTERSTDPAVPDRFVMGVARPRTVVIRPERPNGAALIVAPGGGYARMVLDHEGYMVGRWLAARGWTVFVLFYRLPGEGWANRADVPLADAQRAIRLVRANAASYGIDPRKVGIMGFSAGGHVCGSLATRYAAQVYPALDAADRLSARPDFAAPMYAVQSMIPPLAHPGSRDMLLGPNPSPALEQSHSVALNVTRATPPCFMVHAEDDRTVPVANTRDMDAALRRAGVPVETHLFAEGGHGFGITKAIGKPAGQWPELFTSWARGRGIA